MGTYADIKSKQMVRLLNWLAGHKSILLTGGGNHPYKVTCIHNGKSYPIPAGHSTMNKNIVKHFMEWLVENDICTKQEFDDHI